ncbi:MAG: hypothetical protein EOO73_08815 [Myxococcales bacterium]|nr:MAG: hypothetical protein EOO73_08815 [Myxococcales bacterium]
MNGDWLRGGVVVLLSLATLCAARRSPACTPVKALTPDAVLSPAVGAVLGGDSALLFRTRDEEPAFISGVDTPNVNLVPGAAFESFTPLDSRWAFFHPARPLIENRDYVLQTADGALVRPFHVSAVTPRVDATVTISVVARAVPEQSLGFGDCYSGPLEGRPFTRVAEVVVTSLPASRLLVSVTALDSLSGELIEDVFLPSEQQLGSRDRSELPLPRGVGECLRVQVLDYAGTALVDEESLCVTGEVETRIHPVAVFERTDVAPPEPVDSGFVDIPPGGERTPEPGEGTDSRTSKSCALSSPAQGAPSAAGIIALGWLVLARRRLARSR